MEEQKQAPEQNSAVTGEEKFFAALSYFGLLCLIPLLLKKDNKFIFFHAKQGLALCIIGIIFPVAAIIISFIPFLGILVAIAAIALSLLWLIAIVQVIMGNMWRMPVAANIAEKINL